MLRTYLRASEGRWTLRSPRCPRSRRQRTGRSPWGTGPPSCLRTARSAGAASLPPAARPPARALGMPEAGNRTAHPRARARAPARPALPPARPEAPAAARPLPLRQAAVQMAASLLQPQSAATGNTAGPSVAPARSPHRGSRPPRAWNGRARRDSGGRRRGEGARAAVWRDARDARSAPQNQQDFQNGGSGRRAGRPRPIGAAGGSWRAPGGEAGRGRPGRAGGAGPGRERGAGRGGEGVSPAAGSGRALPNQGQRAGDARGGGAAGCVLGGGRGRKDAR